MTPNEAAEWLVARVRAEGYLDHPEFIDFLMSADDSLATYNDAGNPAVSKAVLKALRDLKADDVLWSRSELHWRLREEGDEPGRLAF